MATSQFFAQIFPSLIFVRSNIRVYVCISECNFVSCEIRLTFNNLLGTRYSVLERLISIQSFISLIFRSKILNVNIVSSDFKQLPYAVIPERDRNSYLLVLSIDSIYRLMSKIDKDKRRSNPARTEKRSLEDRRSDSCVMRRSFVRKKRRVAAVDKSRLAASRMRKKGSAIEKHDASSP